MSAMLERIDLIMPLADEIWSERNSGIWRTVPADRYAMKISRKTAEAVGFMVAASDVYDPEEDRRVLWLRTLAKSLRDHPHRYPKADGDLEACVRFLLKRMPSAPASTRKDLYE